MADNNKNKNKSGFFDKFKSNKKEAPKKEANNVNDDTLSNKKQDPKKNIKVIMGVYLVLLFGLIGYITYFYLFKAPEINKMPANAITMSKSSKVLRGSILDAEGRPIAYSERTDAFNQKRIYPYDDLYAAAIGYASSRYGTTGMENIYNKQLTSYDPLTLSEYIKTYGLKKAFENRGVNLAPQVGDSIVTTLNTPLQKTASAAIGDNEGAVVAIEPKTGAVLAMVSKPTFNPNDLGAEMKSVAADEAIGKPNKTLLNQATHDPTAPGSVFKTVTISSALENIPGIQNRIFDDKGSIKIGNYTLPNENFRAFGEISLARALSVSSNVVFGTL